MDPTSPSCQHSPTPAAAAAASPLQAASADRVNQQREPSSFMSSFQRSGTIVTAGGQSRDSSVHDKISQFNTLAVQSKQLERKTTDAALKRAMLGREEAEVEMRRYRDEARALRRQVEEGKERERKVGERLETVMVRSSLFLPRPHVSYTAKLTTPLPYCLGELRSRKGNARTHAGPLGEGDPARTKGHVQVAECHRQTAGGAQGGARGRQNRRDRTSRGEGARPC